MPADVGLLMSDYRAWPRPARTMAVEVDAAVRAVLEQDAGAFDQARAAMLGQDPQQLRVLLGAMTRDLLERAYPDGLDSDDAEQVLTRCLHSASSCYPEAHRDALVVALTGALGVSETDESIGSDEVDVRAHGLLLIADLIGAQGASLPSILDAALSELMRAQTIELP